MAGYKNKPTKVHTSHDGDFEITSEGHHVMTLNYYVRIAQVAMQNKQWSEAWYAWGAAIARIMNPTEEREMRLLEKKCYTLMLDRKPDRKKDKDKDKRKRVHAPETW